MLSLFDILWSKKSSWSMMPYSVEFVNVILYCNFTFFSTTFWLISFNKVVFHSPSNPLNLTSGTFCPSFGNMDCREASLTCFSDASFLSAVSINESRWRK